MTPVNDLKWYSTFVFLTGTMLGFADPLTDIFTLAEFYKQNNMIFFGLGLAFLIVPCFVFGLASCLAKDTCPEECGFFCCTRDCLMSFNPFSSAWESLKGFVLCLENFKNLWRGEQVNCGDRTVDEVNKFLSNVKLARFTEAVTESVPQFIIQLYAANVQEQPLKIIQIISLSVSCLSIIWAFTSADENLHAGVIEVTKKDKVLFFVVNLFLLTSRLFTICYFIMAFRIWIILVLGSHSIIVACDDFSRDHVDCTWWLFFLLFHWIRDDLSAPYEFRPADRARGQRKRLRRLQWLSQGLYVMENLAMILLYYYLGKFSNTWYAFPLTMYVCTATILGASIRLIHFSFLLNPSRVAPEPRGRNARLEAAGP